MRTWITRVGLLAAVCSTLAAGSAARASDARQTPQVRAVARVKSAVVNIHTERLRDREGSFEGRTGSKVNGMGTGIIIDERGYIVTNEHVIADTETRRVTLYDGSTYSARIISGNRKCDLAIVKIDASRPLPVIPMGTSSDVMLGETVLAVGNPFGYEHSVSQGIISSLSRDVEVNETQGYKNLLQTDASINPGNSGGPLINLDGEVVGINVAIRAGAQRIGFAIPIDDARRHIANLLDIRQLNDAYHGLVAHDVKTPQHRKLVVDAAEPNSPAAAAGFLPGDVVSQVGSQAVSDRADLERSLLGHAVGAPVEVVVERNSESVKLTVQLARVDAAQMAGYSRTRPATVRPRLTGDDPQSTRLWKLLGLRLEKAPASLLDAVQTKTKYRGGMKVLEVRESSPAAQHGMRTGDVLVGLNKWETTKQEDVSWVMNQMGPSGKDEPLTFYVVRGKEVLYGKLQIAQRPNP